MPCWRHAGPWTWGDLSSFLTSMWLDGCDLERRRIRRFPLTVDGDRPCRRRPSAIAQTHRCGNNLALFCLFLPGRVNSAPSREGEGATPSRMITLCPCFARRVKYFSKNTKLLIGQWVGYCAWGCFSVLGLVLRPHGRSNVKKGPPRWRPFRLTRCGVAYSAACFCGGSSAPDLWISAT